MKIYLGFKRVSDEKLSSLNSASTESHPQYDFFYGPFKSYEEASNYVKAMTGQACDKDKQFNTMIFAFGYLTIKFFFGRIIV